MAKGNYAAYQKLQPIDIDWAKIAKSGVDAELARRDKKKAEEKAEQDELQTVEFNPLQDVVTNIDSVDQAMALGIQEAGKINQQDFERASTDIEFKRSAEYKMRSANIQNFPTKLKNLSAGVTELAKKYADAEMQGQVSSWDESLGATLHGAFVTEKVIFKADEKTGEPYAMVAQTSEDLKTGKDGDNPNGYVYNDDGSISMKKVTPNEVFKGLGEYRITKKMDVAAEAQKFGKALGKKVETDIKGNMASGLTITKEQKFEFIQETANKAATDLLGSAGSPTDLAKNIWADKMGRKSRELTENDMLEIRDNFVQSASAYYDQTEEKTFNQRTPNTGSGGSGNKTPKVYTPNYVTNPSTGELSKTSVTVPVTENGQTVNKKFENVYEVQLGGVNGVTLAESETTVRTVKNFYIDEDGNTFADVTTSTKPSGRVDFNKPEEVEQGVIIGAVKNWESETKTVKLTNKDFQAIATNPAVVSEQGLRFPNGKAFMDYLKLKRGSTPTPPPEKPKGGNTTFDPNGYKKGNSNNAEVGPQQ